MTRKAIASMLLALLAGLGYRLYSRGFGTLGGTPSEVTTPFRTEQEWIVGEVAGDLEEMARFARDGTLPSAGPSPARPVVENPWSPAAYTAHARELLKGVAPSSTSGPTDQRLLTALTRPTAPSLAEENGRVSEELRRDFRSPEVHEGAALLVAAFALREADGDFADVRPALNRVTAHLAFADALRGSGARSLEGRYAEIAHALLCGRTAEALDAIRALPANPSAPEGAWRTALALRATQDWRGFGDPEAHTLLERLAYLRALVITRSAAETLAFVNAAGEAERGDVARLTAPGQLGVELGNATVLATLPALLQEIHEVRGASRLPPLAAEGLAAELAASPGRCLGPSGPQALDWGAWAGFYARAIAEHAARADTHLRRVLGDVSAADRHKRELDREWGALPVYVVATTHRTRRQEMDLSRIAEAIDVAIATPQLVTAHNWGRLQDGQHYEPVRRGMPPAAGWFDPALPRGTAFDARRRLERLGHAPRDLAALASLAALDPRDFTIASRLALVQHGPRATADQLRGAFGTRVEFDQRAARAVTEAVSASGDAAQKQEALEANCRRTVTACLDLAHHLVDQGRDEDAAETFERVIADPSVDRVLAASHSGWLIDRYYERGDRARARALADQAAATGSYPGLSFRANLMERMGRFAEAERDYAAMAKGYQTPSSLVAFHYRMARGRGRAEFEPKLARSSRSLFPNGLEKVGDLGTAAPADGAYVSSHSAELLKAGLRTGDVIVGLDGWRIREAEQYEAVVRFDRADAMEFTVWRGGYQQVRATVKHRWLGVKLVDFPVKGWVAGKREIQG